MTAPWHRPPPRDAADVATDDDDFVTVARWPREVYRPHWHEEFNWIVPMRPGRLVIAIEERELAIDGDRWLCVFPRTAHAVIDVSDDTEVLSLFVPPALMLEGWQAQRPPPELGVRWIEGGRGEIARGLALAWGEQRFGHARPDDTDRALGLFLAGWLWRSYAARPHDGAPVARQLRLALGEPLAAAVDRHLADSPFPWAALARHAGVSQRTLQRRFAAALGRAPSEILVALRIERAVDLLRDPARPVGDVALACGFATQAHFATVFKAVMGRAPSRWRAG